MPENLTARLSALADAPSARKRAAKARPVPAEQDAPAALYAHRLSITTTSGQVQALRSARVEDGIQATARLRAMIALWMDDPKIRARVDRLAADWQ